MAVPNYTNELLAKNFNNIANGFDVVAAGLGALENHVYHIESQVTNLTKQVAQLSAKAPKRNGKLFLLTMVGASAYVGYKYCEFEFEGRKGRSEDLSTKRPANTQPPTGENNDKPNNA